MSCKRIFATKIMQKLSRCGPVWVCLPCLHLQQLSEHFHFLPGHFIFLPGLVAASNGNATCWLLHSATRHQHCCEILMGIKSSVLVAASAWAGQKAEGITVGGIKRSLVRARVTEDGDCLFYIHFQWGWSPGSTCTLESGYLIFGT